MKKLYSFLIICSTWIFTAQTLETNKANLKSDGCITYEADANQNRIPDFSHAGYKGGGVAIPDISVEQTISPIAGDNTAHIQAAIDAVGNLPLDANGFRGAVLLNPGTYEVSGQLFMNKSGVVLRGSGDGRTTANPTVILATGNVPVKRDVIELGRGNTGPWDDQVSGTQQNITTNFVQVGSRVFDVADASPYAVGDNIIVFHPSTQAWIDAVDGGGVNNDPEWSVGQYPIQYNRFITAINGNEITIDAPVYNHLDKSLSQSYIFTFDRQNMRTNIGIENLRIDIIPSDINDPFDENHAQSAIAFHEVEDGWARNLTATGFEYAGVKTRKASRITVRNAHAIDPISIITGGNRYNFAAGNFSNNILFDNCYANEGRHTYAVNGTPSASGIVFLRSISENPLAASEPHRQWSNGILYDNLRDFGTLPGSRKVVALNNRSDGGSSHGWAAVNSVLWNVDVSRPGLDGKMILEKPPIGQNYAIGTKGVIENNIAPLGYIEHNNATGQLEIESLYEAQLLCRTNAVISNFAASSTEVAPGETVTFTDNSQGSVTSYNWDFGQDATPATATGAGPHDVNYSTTGQKTVKLTVSNGTQSDQKIKSPYINVEANNLLAVDDSETLDQNSSVTTLIASNDITPTSIPNKALLFNGSTDDSTGGSVFYDQTDLINDYPFTMMAWFKTTSTENRTLLYFGNSSSNATRHSIMLNNGSILMEARVRISSGNTPEENINYSASLNDGVWHHVAAVHESPTSRKLYVDGVEVGANTNNFDSVTPQQLSSFSAGNRDDRNPDSFFNGEIDDVRLYGSSLSNAEINNALQGYECSAAERLIKWDFNEQPNAVAVDQFSIFDGAIAGTTAVPSTLSIGDLDATIISAPSNGTASFTDNFEINYVPDSGFTGSDSLVYQLRFGDCEVSEATITYTIQSASCPVPINLQVSNITETNADISWDNEASATGGYEYVLIDDGTIPDATTPADASLPNGTNNVSFSSLTGGTTYDFYVRSNCGSNNLSDWSVVLSFTTVSPPPTGNTALSFDGVNDKVSFGSFSNPPDATTYPFTMTAWFNSTASGDQFIVYKGRSSSNFLGHTIRMDSGIVRLEAVLGSGNANTKDILDSGTTNDGEWHHVAAVFESPTSRSLYVDGILKGTDNETANVFGINLPVRFSVGVRDDATPNGFFSGEIDEVRIYESALTQNQVENVMDGLSCSNYSESLYYDFNDITLPTVVDEFGNQEATITGASIVSSPLNIVSDTSPDADTDGVSNLCDLDDDNDGILDSDEQNFANVATFGTASQSSTRFGGDAPKAIDGNTDGNYNNDSVTHTDNNNTTEYWEVDLGENFDISEIIFYNRTNCCSDRISNVFVFIADTPFPSNVNDLAGAQANADFTFQFANGESAASVTIPVSASGRYVRLQKSGNNTNNYLSIAELEVFAVIDTDGDGLADALDLDSDSDGCSDANEYYENANIDNNADGNDDGEYGNAATLSVDAFGQVIGASYSGSATGLANVRDENVADACTFVQDTSGDWNTASNWNTNTIPQANQLAIIDDGVNSNFDQSVGVKRLTLRPNSQLNVNPTGILNIGEQLTNEGLITFESDATGSGQFDEFDGMISGAGEVTVERFIPAGDNINDVNLGRAYRVLTSTVTTSSNINFNWQEGASTNTENPNPGYGTHITGSISGANGFDATPSGNPSMFTFNSASTGIGAQDWEVIPGTNGSNNLKAGKGYLTFIRGDRSIDVTNNSTVPTNTILRAKGNLISGQINYAADIDNMATAPGDYSLVANPYQAVVDYLETDRTNLTDFFYVWDASISARGAYVTVDISDVLNVSNNVNDSDADNFLSPGQAFFVQNDINGNGQLTYNENDKNTSANQVTVFSTNTEFVIRSSLFKTNELQEEIGLVDGLVVRFNNNYTTPADYEDAEKFINLDENYAVVNNGLRSIDKQALPNIGHEVQLSITPFTANNYSLVYEISNKPEGLGVFLKDNYLGTQTELSENSAYNFSIDANIPESISENRFSLVFENTTLGVNDNAFGTDFRLYPNPTRDGLFSIETQGLRGKDVEVELYNVLGQQLISQNLKVESNGLINVDGSGLSTGVYVVKLKQDKHEFIGKLIVE